MKPAPFEYFRPGTLAEALRILSSQENCKVLAGGQSLMAMLNLRYLLPDVLVDINRIPELAEITCSAGKVRIGAMTRQRHIERHEELATVAPIFAEALHLVGHRQTRNRGTIGGSLCHLDPAAELPTIALLMDAAIEVAGADGQRRLLPISDFIAGFMMPNIGPDEIVTAIEVSLWKAGHGHAFREFARRHGDFAIASAAALVETDTGGVIERIAIALGGVGSVPQRLPAAEELLRGSRGTDTDIEAAADLCSGLEIIGDFHGSPEYRLSVARAMLKRSLKAAVARAAGAMQ
ncbi:Caffeine dehydrogenase subunit beta [Hartmannibacter diazotrophicus]|uniref:Caffeine dehydrogenase subunit beta n=1 Tax=Hartmannibacter diazotrophicus TaxID=1482074 RepID=A0A2C9D0I8_9HYPH|nr:xanthine dehydrogenase family protein subunit M [Hartmannibacter diazotrophicus]SON53897.1 Caffeine dehydrogenase subunit beta [Hartmannibacter diazotrophicus]